MKDYYKILQVDPQAEAEIIDSAYRRLARKYHPDANPSPDATARMQEINEAYEVLSDPLNRSRYDAARHAQQATGAVPPYRDRARDGVGPKGPPSPPPARPTAPPAPSIRRIPKWAGLLIAAGTLLMALAVLGSVAGAGLRARSGRSKTSQIVTRQPTEQATPRPEATLAAHTTATGRYSGPPAMTIDPNKSYTAVIHTEKGDIRAELFAQQAPQTGNNFVFLARDGFYNGLTFFWVKPDFVAQTGDPEETGHGGPGYTIPDENSGQPFQAGTLGMAKKADQPNSAGSQFFITLSDQLQLNSQFTSFGRVVQGMDVLLSLAPRDPPGADLPPGDKVLSIDIEEK